MDAAPPVEAAVALNSREADRPRAGAGPLAASPPAVAGAAMASSAAAPSTALRHSTTFAVPAPTASSPVSRSTTLATPARASAANPAIPASPLAPDAGIVSFQTSGDSWIEVTDAKGQATLRRSLHAGETASASGVPPLVVVIGRADATTVRVRGRPFDLQPVAKNNVARFEVR